MNQTGAGIDDDGTGAAQQKTYMQLAKNNHRRHLRVAGD